MSIWKCEVIPFHRKRRIGMTVEFFEQVPGHAEAYFLFDIAGMV